MGRFFKRLVRTIVPVLVLWGTGALQAHPKTVWILPVVAAAGKGIRETFPNTAVAKWWPF